MSTKRAALLTVAMLFTMVIAAASMNSGAAGNHEVAPDGYGISSLR